MVLIGRLVILAFTVSFSIVAIINTKKLAMFDAQGLPSARLWPVICSILVLILSAINLVELFPQMKTIDRSVDPKKLVRVALFYVLLFVFSVFLCNILGFFTSMAIFLFISLLLWNGIPWARCIPVSIGLPAVMWFICSFILKMAQFPRGLFL